MAHQRAKGRVNKVLAVVTISLLVAAGTVAIVVSNATGGGEWGCPGERLGIDSAQLDTGDGYRSPDEAVEAELRLLAQDGIATEAALVDASRAESGENRFERETGKLFLSDELIVQVTVVELEDGTFSVGRSQYCSPPPARNEGSQPTPTDEANGGS